MQAQASAEAPKVELTGRVIDRANVLSPPDEVKLASVCEKLEQKTSDQLVVVTLDTLNGASIEQVGYALGNAWGVGQAKLDNGVLLLVVPSERRVRIEVGRGLEGLLTDERAAAIVRDMLPSFGRGAYYQGMARGTAEIARLLEGDPKRPRPKVA